MNKKCDIVFIDNLENVVVSQREYFEMILKNIMKIYSEKLESLNITCNDDKLLVAIDDYEFTFSHKIVVFSKNTDADRIEAKVENILKELDSEVKTLFVVDFCLDSPKNIEPDTGIDFASGLCENNKNLNMMVAFCTGVPSYDRVNRVIGERILQVFHRALTPDDKFSAEEFIFEESRYKKTLSEISPAKNQELLFLLDILINNSYQNTQYLGDLLMSAFLFCEGMDKT